MIFNSAVFDLDGTLLDSMSLWDRFGADYLDSKKLSYPEHIREILRPMTIVDAAVYFKESYELQESAEELVKEMDALIEHQYREIFPPKKGAADFLSRLSTINIPMAVATATEKHLAEMALERLGMLSFFPNIFTCTEEGTGKDKPDIFLTAARSLHTDPSETIVFEDSFYAIETAKTSGFHCIGIYDDSARRQWPDVQALCDLSITDFNELEVYHEEGVNHCRIRL